MGFGAEDFQGVELGFQLTEVFRSVLGGIFRDLVFQLGQGLGLRNPGFGVVPGQLGELVALALRAASRRAVCWRSSIRYRGGVAGVLLEELLGFQELGEFLL